MCSVTVTIFVCMFDCILTVLDVYQINFFSIDTHSEAGWAKDSRTAKARPLPVMRVCMETSTQGRQRHHSPVNCTY